MKVNLTRWKYNKCCNFGSQKRTITCEITLWNYFSMTTVSLVEKTKANVVLGCISTFAAGKKEKPKDVTSSSNLWSSVVTTKLNSNKNLVSAKDWIYQQHNLTLSVLKVSNAPFWLYACRYKLTYGWYDDWPVHWGKWPASSPSLLAWLYLIKKVKENVKYAAFFWVNSVKSRNWKSCVVWRQNLAKANQKLVNNCSNLP